MIPANLEKLILTGAAKYNRVTYGYGARMFLPSAEGKVTVITNITVEPFYNYASTFWGQYEDEANTGPYSGNLQIDGKIDAIGFKAAADQLMKSTYQLEISDTTNKRISLFIQGELDFKSIPIWNPQGEKYEIYNQTGIKYIARSFDTYYISSRDIVFRFRVPQGNFQGGNSAVTNTFTSGANFASTPANVLLNDTVEPLNPSGMFTNSATVGGLQITRQVNFGNAGGDNNSNIETYLPNQTQTNNLGPPPGEGIYYYDGILLPLSNIEDNNNANQNITGYLNTMAQTAYNSEIQQPKINIEFLIINIQEASDVLGYKFGNI